MTEASPLFTLSAGTTPLVVSVPHSGTFIPQAVRERLCVDPAETADTDHFVDRLYEGVLGLGASLIVAGFSRFVVDLNRPPDDRPLYPGRVGTGLVPTEDFSGCPLWHTPPDKAEIVRRRRLYWAPYHRALQAELERVKAVHGHAVLWDGHSIRSEVPRLFEGALPHLNLGTFGGRSCAPDLAGEVAEALSQGPFSTVVNGRFQGGHITRAYGAPDRQVHALQLEVAQRAYMDEAGTPEWCDSRAMPLRDLLHTVLGRVIRWSP